MLKFKQIIQIDEWQYTAITAEGELVQLFYSTDDGAWDLFSMPILDGREKHDIRDQDQGNS